MSKKSTAPGSSKEDRKRLYVLRRQETGLSRAEWGRLFALGVETNVAQEVYKKESMSDGSSSAKGVNKGEALASELLALLYRDGYDINSIKFDGQGRITSIERLDPPPGGTTSQP